MRWWRSGVMGLVGLVALWPGLGHGQTSTSFTFHAGATSVTNGAVLPASNFSTIVVQVEGTFVGTVQFEKKTKNATGYVAVQCTNATDRTQSSTADAPGYWECPGGAYSFRVPVTARTSGTIVVTGMGTTAVAGRGSGGGAPQGISSVMALDRTYGEAVSQATARRDGSDAAGAYVVTFYDPTSGLIQTCEVSGLLDDCNRAVTLLAGKFFRLLKAGVVKWEVDSDGNLTEGSIDVETPGVTILTTEEDWWDVAACQNGTAQLVWNVPTSNAPAAVCDPDSTPEAYASFDATTDESFTKSWVLPTGFTGAIDVHLIWKAAATSGAAGWCAQLVRIPDGTTSGQSVAAQSASNCVSDPAKGTTLQENHATITGVACSSCAARDRVKVVVSRDANGSAVTDDMAGDAHLMKVGRTWRVAK